MIAELPTNGGRFTAGMRVDPRDSVGIPPWWVTQRFDLLSVAIVHLGWNERRAGEPRCGTQASPLIVIVLVANKPARSMRYLTRAIHTPAQSECNSPGAHSAGFDVANI